MEYILLYLLLYLLGCTLSLGRAIASLTTVEPKVKYERCPICACYTAYKRLLTLSIVSSWFGFIAGTMIYIFSDEETLFFKYW